MPKVIRNLTRLITLSYLQSLQVTEGQRSPEEFTSLGLNFGGVGRAIEKEKKPKVRASLQSIVNTLFPFTGAFQGLRNSDTGWVVDDISKQTFWDVISWRMGVRELGLHSFTFAEKSSIVTIPATSPRPIWKVSLQTDESIPSTFTRTQPWIKYFVTHDSGKTWNRINPLGKPTRFEEDGSVVPRIITFGLGNTSVNPEEINVKSDSDIREIRLRIEMARDPNAPSSEMLTPILRSYRLLLYPRNSLSE